MSEIAQFDNLPDISFIDNLTMKEVEEMAKGGYIRSAREATGNTPTLYPASLPSIMVKEMALLHYQMLQYIDAGPKQTLLKYSTHENLDVLAGNFGLKRRQAERATTIIRFTLAGTGQPSAVGVPEGTRVRTEDGVYFATTEYAEILPGEQSIDVTAAALEAGAESSGIEEGQVNQLVDPIPYVASR